MFVPDHSRILALLPGLPAKWAAQAAKFEAKAAETTCDWERANFLEIAAMARKELAASGKDSEGAARG